MILDLFRSALGGATPESAADDDRRAMRRLREPRATLVVNDVSYPLIDWNPRGFLIGPWRGPLRIGDRIRLRLIIPHHGTSHGFNLEGLVVRRDIFKYTLAGIFVDVESDTLEKLTELFAQRLK